MNALNTMAVIATQSLDLDEFLNLTLRQVISLLGAETGSIYLCDADETTPRRDLPGVHSSLTRNGDANSAMQAHDVFLLTS